MTVFFTVATISYLPQALTLLDSIKKQHPEFDCVIGLVDYAEPQQFKELRLLNKYKIIQLHELYSKDFDFITSAYSPAELANCSKVLFAEFILKQEIVTEVVFSDSDILFFDRLPDTPTGSEITITPHFISPPALDFISLELEVINAGMFNAGFFRLKKSKNTARFLDWLKDRCVTECVDNRCKGLYFDQTWYNFVPLYFQNVHIERDLGCNVAYWNLHERSIAIKDDRFIINNSVPLKFFHFSGWSMESPDSISQFQHRYTKESRPDVLPLLQLYQELLSENQYNDYRAVSCYYKKEEQFAEGLQKGPRKLGRLISLLKKLRQK